MKTKKGKGIFIPNISIFSGLIFLVIVVITYFATIHSFIPEFSEIFSKAEEYSWRDFWKALFFVVSAYVLLSAGICFFVRALKKKELKPYQEEGLIWFLIIGLKGGLIVGLILGGLIVILMGDPIIESLIAGLIVGLMFGLIVGLIFGLIYEFKK